MRTSSDPRACGHQIHRSGVGTGAGCSRLRAVALDRYTAQKKSGEPVSLGVFANSIPDDWVSPKIEDGYKITVFKVPGEIDKINLSFRWHITGVYPPHAKITNMSGKQLGIAPLAKIPGTSNWYETQIKDIPIEGARLELPTFAFQVGQKNYRWKPSGYLHLIPTKDSVRICGVV